MLRISFYYLHHWKLKFFNPFSSHWACQTPNNLGRIRLIWGKNVIRSKATIIAMKSGNNGLITLVMVVFATPTPINSMEPTGGVHRPILRFRIIMIPKCIGSIPSSITIGKKIGVKIRTAGVMSMNTPTNSRIRLIMISITNLLSLIPSNTSVTVCGISSNDITHDMDMDVAISNITIEVVATELRKIWGSSLIFSSL